MSSKMTSAAMMAVVLACAAPLALCFTGGARPSTSFVPQWRDHHSTKCSSSTTSLHVAPTMIISPIIKKWREEQAKKNIPMASDEEMAQEAPGLRVGVNAWKWPPVWPYDADFFERQGDSAPETVTSTMSNMMNNMPGQIPTLPEPTEVNKLDSVDFWSVQKKGITTDVDEGAAARIQNHYSYYLKDGMDVLEFGAAENSYLPDELKLNRHVGIGLNPEMMEQNERITEKMVLDLNKVKAGDGIDAPELDALEGQFDAILMANTFDFLTDPREVFRSAWKLLKPGGIMMCPFVNKDAYSNNFGEAQTKMWKQFNDDQHMYVCGSFFEFSASRGWNNLQGFDVSPLEARKSGPLDMFNPNKPMNAYVVQARKQSLPDQIDAENAEASIEAMLSLAPVLEQRDKLFLAPRVARTFTFAKSEEQKRRIQENLEIVPKVYESLIRMDQFTFSFSLQSQLAAELISDADFTANPEQLTALKMGLGLKPPSAEFWEPIGRLTATMKPTDKVSLLSYLVPRFGTGKAEQDAALEAFVTALQPTFKIIKETCPKMKQADVELLGTELLAAEVLIPGRSTKQEFAQWLGSLTEQDLERILSDRKQFNQDAKQELRDMREARAAEQKRKEEEEKKQQEELARVRKERSMVFNEKTGKMEYVEPKEKK